MQWTWVWENSGYSGEHRRLPCVLQFIGSQSQTQFIDSTTTPMAIFPYKYFPPDPLDHGLPLPKSHSADYLLHYIFQISLSSVVSHWFLIVLHNEVQTPKLSIRRYSIILCQPPVEFPLPFLTLCLCSSWKNLVRAPKISLACSYLRLWWAPFLPRGAVIKNVPAKQETWVQFLGEEDPLEKKMATQSSILAWAVLWTEEPGGLQSMGSQKSQTLQSDWVLSTSFLYELPSPNASSLCGFLYFLWSSFPSPPRCLLPQLSLQWFHARLNSLNIQELYHSFGNELKTALNVCFLFSLYSCCCCVKNKKYGIRQTWE